jgi:hypothetical protein
MSKPPTTQRRELTQACQRHGWDIVQVFVDANVSDAKGRDARTAFNTRTISGLSPGTAVMLGVIRKKGQLKIFGMILGTLPDQGVANAIAYLARKEAKTPKRH